MTILFALLAIVVGAALVFAGYRVARVLIPLAGFLAGLSLGGAIMSDMEGSAFLGTMLGITVGLLAGLLFAVLAYLYYYAAVVILAGAIAYWLGSSFMIMLGFQPGLLSMLTGLGLGIVVGVSALLINAPKYVLIGLTSIAGSVLAIGGVMLLFNQIPLEAFSYAAARYTISNSFIWSVVAIVLAGVGMAMQAMTSVDYEFEEWALGHDSGGGKSVPPTMAHRT